MTKSKTEGSTWSLRNMSPEVINAAKIAAKRDNEFVSVWVSKTIMNAAQQSLKSKREVAKPEDILSVVKDLSDKIDKLYDREKKGIWKWF